MITSAVKNPRIFVLLLTASILSACAGSSPNFSILPDSNHFKQSAGTLNNKLDILWVVDNSGSMTALQNNMTSNFNSFISNFSTKGYDFKIAVTSSDSYLASPQFNNVPSMARFSDGVSTHSGVYVLLPSTLNLINKFVVNASLGSYGSGDERAFSSFREALNSSQSQNVGFLRPDSFLAIIILSDEDDFSGSGRSENGGNDHDYNASTLETVDSYLTYLDAKTGTTVGNRRYSVSALAVLDTTCKNIHKKDPNASVTIIGQRYIDLANKTDGVLGSICDASYATALDQIQSKIAELSTQFYLSRVPDVSTIVVKVNSVLISQGATNGWTYNDTNNSVVFHGSAVPQQGADIVIDFTPVTVK